jgi:hypothetical protein
MPLHLLEFGLYSHCEYLDTSAGACLKAKIGSLFVPYEAIASDIPTDYLDVTDSILQGYIIYNSSNLASLSKAAYYLILLGSICALASFALVFV